MPAPLDQCLLPNCWLLCERHHIAGYRARLARIPAFKRAPPDHYLSHEAFPGGRNVRCRRAFPKGYRMVNHVVHRSHSRRRTARARSSTSSSSVPLTRRQCGTPTSNRRLPPLRQRASSKTLSCKRVHALGEGEQGVGFVPLLLGRGQGVKRKAFWKG